MEDATSVKRVSLVDVAALLETKLAYLSGGRCPSGSPIITFPSTSLAESTSEDQIVSVLSYLLSVLQQQNNESGVVFVIDRRTTGWPAVKTVLNAIFSSCTRNVENMFILRSAGIFTSFIEQQRMKSFGQEQRAKMVILYDADELGRHIDINQLTPELGGFLPFNHIDWVSHQLAVESISTNAVNAREDLNQFCCKLNEPCDTKVATAAELEETYQCQLVEKCRIVERLGSLLDQANELLGCFRQTCLPDGEQGQHSNELPPSTVQHVTAMERLIIQLEEAQKKFDIRWQDHETDFQALIKSRRSEEKYFSLRDQVNKHFDYVSSLSVSSVVDSADEIRRHKTDLFQRKTQLSAEMGEVQQLRIECDSLKSTSHKICVNIEDLDTDFNLCQQQISSLDEHFEKSLDLHEALEQAKNWIDQGGQLLSEDSASETLHEKLSQYCATQSSVDDLQALQSSFSQPLTPSMEKKVQETILHINETLAACVAKRDLVDHQLVAAKKTELTVTKSAPSSSEKDPPSTSYPLLNKRAQSHDIRDVRVTVTFNKEDLNCSDASAANLALAADCDSTRQRRGNVIQELIATEKTYTRDLDDILQGYAANIESSEMQHLVPTELHENRGLLFDNIELIHQFHSGVFMKALESSSKNIIDIAQCFVHHKKDFYIYSGYCQNKTSAEAVIERIGGERNAFFLECQLKLGHSLPLTAYLLKPLQRLTKYQLLLKELAGVCITKEEALAMRNAVDSMRHVTQHVNDFMHQLLITGFEGDLSTLGQLLIQGELEVWTDRKRDRASRHGFLYEKCLLLCKKKKDDSSQSHDQARYIFKNAIQMNQVGLREVVKSSDDRRFELSVSIRAGRSGEVWTMQAGTKELKAEWVTHIQKLLLRQLYSIKRRKQRIIPAVQDVMRDLPAVPDVEHLPAVRSDGNNNSNNTNGR